MAIPQPKDYRVQQAIVMQRADRDVIAALKVAQADINAQLKAIAGRRSLGIGEAVRQSQLQLAKREIQRELSTLYTKLGRITEARRLDAAARVLNLNKALDTFKLVSAGLPDGADIAQAIADAELDAARSGIDRMLARTAGASYVPLAQRVYVSEVGLNGRIDRIVNSALARGLSAVEFARSVKDFINPLTPGGTRYAAMRLARTEINNAAHALAIDAVRDKPWVDHMQWHLSGSHPRIDVCDGLARGGAKGDGVYPKTSVPAKPHPHCFCYVVPILPDEEEFNNALIAGKYDSYIAKYRNIQPGEVITTRKFTGSTPVQKATPATVKKAPAKTAPPVIKKTAPAKAPAPPVKAAAPAKKVPPRPPTQADLARLHTDPMWKAAPPEAQAQMRTVFDQMAKIAPRSMQELKYARLLDQAETTTMRIELGKPTAQGGYRRDSQGMRFANDVIGPFAEHTLQQSVRSNWFSHTDLADNSMLQRIMKHELGHHLEQMTWRLPLAEQQQMWLGVLDSLGIEFDRSPIAKSITPTNLRSRVSNLLKEKQAEFGQLVSRYGSKSTAELLAEIFGEYTSATGANLRPGIAKAGQILAEAAERGAALPPGPTLTVIG